MSRYLRLSLLLILACSACSAAEHRWTRQLAQGVTLVQIVRDCGPRDTGCLPQFINAVVMDPKAPGVQARTVLANDIVWGDDPTKGRETVWSMARRTGAIAAVNGDFHNWCGRPDNLFLLNGELVTDPWSRRAVFAIRNDGTFLFDKVFWENTVTTDRGDSFPLAGMNKVAEWDELILFTPRFHTNTVSRGNTRQEAVIETDSLPVRPGVPIRGRVVLVNDKGNTPIRPGTVVLSGTVTSGAFVRDKLTPGTGVTITTNLKPRDTAGWENVIYTLGGVPWIVKDGRFWMDAEESHVVPAFYDVVNPRTAVGVTKDGRLVIVTVDGRQARAGGMKLSELAELMISMGCVEALNLDGGGSTEMATVFGVLNSPSDGGERATATALAVYGPGPAQSPPCPAGFRIEGLPAEIDSGQTVQLRLVDADTGRPIPARLSEKAVWATDGRIGAVDLSGRFYASKANQGEVRAWIDGKMAKAEVKVNPGRLSRIALYFSEPGKDKPDEQRLTLYARDLNANPLAGQKLLVSVTGGAAEPSEVTTNDAGAAFVTVKWDSGFQGVQRVEARCQDVAGSAERPAPKAQ